LADTESNPRDAFDHRAPRGSRGGVGDSVTVRQADLHLDPYKFQPALDPLAITRLTPPSALNADAQNGSKSDSAGARLAPMLSDADRASGRPAFGIQLRSNF
jgi:hypothetical protein